jgi:ureidoglycolate hydrolase
MEDRLLEIREYNGEGYHPLIDFGSWRVALLRWGPGSQAEEIESMERHTQTDEVFVLLEGWAALVIGGNQGKVDDLQAAVMERGKLYNVKQNTWHTALLSRDVLILIVENRDTGKGNSEFFQLTAEQKQVILGLEYRP